MSFRPLIALLIFLAAGLALVSLAPISTPIVEEKPEAIADTATTTVTRAPILYDYLEVMDGCGVHFEGDCVLAYTRATTSAPVALRLRPGMVLKIEKTEEVEGERWYKIAFDEWLRYPERVAGGWYVRANSVRTFSHEGWQELVEEETPATSTKRIVIDRSSQTMTAYDGDELFMQEPISTGLLLTPTPRGIFKVYKKTPARYMQGPLPGISDQYYDLPGVPWNLYFTLQGGVIHGAYWHESFGQPWSHGCVNLSPEHAQKLYEWAELGTAVIVQD